MKLIILLALTLFSVSSFALQAGDSWSRIFKAKDVVLNYDEKLGNIDLANACLTQNEVRSLKPFRQCKVDLVAVKAGENKDKFTDWRCNNWVVEHASLPRTSMRTVCAEYKYDSQSQVCSRHVQVPVTVAKTINVLVSEGLNAEVANSPFQKQYTIPDCP